MAWLRRYNTDVFQYWHLDGEQLKDHLPPLDAKATTALHDYAYSMALQAAIWGIAPTTFYAWRYNDALGPKAHAAPGDIWRMSNISTPELSEKAGYVTPNVNTVYGFGFMDLGAEPIILTVPNSRGRYYMVEVVEHVDQRLRLPGGCPRAMAAARSPCRSGLEGDLPAGIRRIDAPTRWVLIQPRVHLKDQADLPGARGVRGDHHSTTVQVYGQTGPRRGQIRLPRTGFYRSQATRSAPSTSGIRSSSGRSCWRS